MQEMEAKIPEVVFIKGIETFSFQKNLEWKV
jgi:hypothetical protein